MFSKLATCIGVAEEFLLPVPSCPLLLFPHVHTVPSAFNVAICVFEDSTSGTAIFPLGTTFTNIVIVLLVIVCLTKISAFPICFPVIIPSLVTSATLSFKDSYSKFSVSTTSFIKLNLLFNDAFTCFCLLTSTLVTFSSTNIYVPPITSYLFLFANVEFPNSP